MHQECTEKHWQPKAGQPQRNLLQSPMLGAFVLNLVFAVIEFVGGYWADSVSIYADALHDLGDALVLGSGAYMEYLSQQISRRHSYGGRRWSVLSALFSSGVLLVGSLLMIGMGVYRFYAPGTPIGSSMVVIAVLGILFNAFAIKVLGHDHHSCHEHDGDAQHSHNHSMFSLHLLEDLLGWVAILFGGLLIWKTGWYWIDPLLSVVISLFILRFAWKGFKGVQSILTQAYPPGFDPAIWRKKIVSISGVQDVHDLHAWSLDGKKHVASLHVVCEPKLEQSVKAAVRKLFAEAGKYHVTIETECSSIGCK